MNRINFTAITITKLFLFVLLFNAPSVKGYYYNEKTPLQDSSILFLNQWDNLATDYNVFMVGENHSHPNQNAQIKYNLITYLNKHKGVNNVLIEFSSTTGWLLNKLVHDNDTSVIEILNTMPNKSYQALYKALRKYNLNRAEGEKIKIYGIDAEQNSSKIYFALNLLMQDKAISDADSSIQLDLEVCKIEAAKIYLNTNLYKVKNPNNDGGSYSDNVVRCSRNSLESFYQSFLKNRTAFSAYFGVDSNDFYNLMKAVEDYKLATDYDQSKSSYFQAYRERMMIEKLLQIHEQDSTQKYFAQFGKCHTASFYAKEYCHSNGFPTFTNRIEQNPQFKVLVTGISYDYYDDAKLYHESYTSFVESRENDSISLFKNSWGEKNDGMTHPDYLLIAFDESGSANSYSSYSYENVQFHFTYSFGRKFLEKNAFSFQLNALQALSFGKNYDFHALSIKTYPEDRVFINFEYNHFVPFKNNFGDTLSAKTFSNAYIFDLGVDLIMAQPVNLTPFVGVAWMNNSVKFEAPMTNNYILDKTENITINNDAFLVNLGMDFNVKIDAFNIGAKGGYHVDLSNKKWKGTLANYKTNFTGWYAQLFMGFAFD